LPSHETSAGMQKSLPAIGGLCVALIFGLVPLAKWIAPGQTTLELFAHEAIWWGFAAILLLWLRYVEHLPFISIGLRRPTGKTIGFGILAGVILTAIIIVQFAVIIPMLHLSAAQSTAERAAVIHHPLWFRFLLVLRAAVVEEILFRGYLIEKIRQLTGSMTLAVIVSVAAFTYAHLSGWGLAHLIPVCASGIVLALLYIWRRDLPCNMIGHFIVDGIGFLVG
jgi:uncharacterized protein